ncbi:MAG: P-loop NTPase fold protein [Gammaproteobacteria bacterium]|nr:P-loop NTPase fold protein [Gammaproteobacteria bacterium]
MSKESFSEQNNNLNIDSFGEDGRDLLHRRKTGNALSDLMQGFENPRVVALNGNWGTGKTWFLKKWARHHPTKFADTTVVYFDAFEHDYISDPLPALVTALGEEISDGNMDRIKKVAFKLAKPFAQKALSMAVPGTSEAVTLFSKIIEALTDEKEYWNNERERMEGMGKFRSAFEDLISTDNNKRIIFVVDELDRCRPDYALEVLEVIKHFFSVSRVHFVLGVNLKALEDMVSARYGAKDYATEYLEKFIQIKLTLPEEISKDGGSRRNVLEYLDHLCQEMKVPDHIDEWLKSRINLVSRANSISLRQIEHIVSAVTLASPESRRIIDQGKGYYHDGCYGIMVDLIISRIAFPKLYPRFLDATISPDELRSYLGDLGSMLSVETNQWKWAYYTWLLISQKEDQIGTTIPQSGNEKLLERFNGIKDSKDQEYINRIRDDLFGVYSEPSIQQIRNLPKKIQRERLDLFQFHEPK